jgi:uncharacterized membrane protein YphA (DoxX/SURF4 family)
MRDAVVDSTLAAPANTGWKRNAATVCAILLGIIFVVSGGWKVLSPFQTGEVLEQAQVPAGLGVLGAVALGTVELFAAFLLFTPRFRRWGGALGSLLLIFFIGWIAYYYPVLVGHDCSCFPIIKRAVGPNFFVTDGIMLLLGLAAWAWSPAVKSVKIPAVALAALAVVAGASFAINTAGRSHVQIPVPVMVDGKPADLTHGKVFLFFYDPSCMHCDAASKFMSTLNWGDTKVVAIPTVNPQWAASFLHDTKLKASTSLDLEKLRKAFPFVDPPFGVALVNGQAKETFGQAQFNAPLPAPDLKKLGLVK